MPLHREWDPPTIPPLGTERVDLVEEDHAWRAGSGALEHLPHATLALAHVLVQQLGALDGDEVGATLVRHRLRKKRLAAARRPVQQHASWHGEPHGFEELWVANGFDDADSKVVLGTVTKPSRLEEGWTFLSASSKSFMSTASWLSWSSGMAARSLICSATSTRLEMSLLLLLLVLVLVLVSVGVSGEALRGSTKRLWKMRLTAMMAASFVVGEGKAF